MDDNNNNNHGYNEVLDLPNVSTDQHSDSQETFYTADGTKMFGLHAQYEGEDLERDPTAFPQDNSVLTNNLYHVTHYDDAAEREKHLTWVDEEGRYRDADGNLLDSASTTAIHTEGTGGHLYVMDGNGQSYSADAHAEQSALNQGVYESGIYQHFHHTSLSGGDAVAAYGEKYFEEGQLIVISDQSGHYFDRQDPSQATGTVQAILSDLDSGADLSRTNVHLVGKDLNGTTLPATDSTVDEFLAADGDQELLHTLQLSAQEAADRQAAANQPPVVLNLKGEYVG